MTPLTDDQLDATVPSTASTDTSTRNAAPSALTT